MENRPATHRARPIALIVFSLLGMLGFTGRAAYLVVTSLQGFDPAAPGDLASGLLGALSMLFCAALLAPMLAYSLRRLKGIEIPPVRLPELKIQRLAILFAVWLASVVAAGVLSSLFDYGWAAAAPFFLLGIVSPIAGLVWVAVGGRPAGSRARLWAVFGLSMAGSTVLAILAEYLVFGIAALGVAVAAAANPQILSAVDQLRDQVANAGDMQAIMTVLAPYLANPLVLLAVLAFAAGIGPLIEEALKPASLWLLGKRLGSPREGFALGALCGAGFALLEGLLAASGSPESLGVGLAGRAASSLMHITASGLVGWGIASARLEGRYLRLVGVYLLAAGLHGLWNGSALVAVYGALRYSLPPAKPDLVAVLAVLAGLGMLVLLFLSMLAVLPLISHRLRAGRQDLPAPAQNDIIGPPLSG